MTTLATHCVHCGAPRAEGDRACPYCSTVYPDAAATPGRPGRRTVESEIEAALDRDNLIEAIKLYREYRGSTLAEAKAAVEAIKRSRSR